MRNLSRPPYREAGGETRAVKTWSGLNPGSTGTTRSKLARRRPRRGGGGGEQHEGKRDLARHEHAPDQSRVAPRPAAALFPERLAQIQMPHAHDRREPDDEPDEQRQHRAKKTTVMSMRISLPRGSSAMPTPVSIDRLQYPTATPDTPPTSVRASFP